MVRDLMRGWKENGVIDTVRIAKGGQKLRGWGLTENGRKLLKSYGPQVDPNGPETGVLDPKWGGRGSETALFGPEPLDPNPPQRKASRGEARPFAKFNSELRKIIDA